MIRAGNIQPPIGKPINPSHSLSQGLVGCWLLNEGGGTIARDSSRLNGTDGVLTNGPVYKETAKGQAILFDGSNDFVTIPNSGPLSITGSISLSSWINVVSAAKAFNQVMMKNNANNSFYGITILSTRKIQFQIQTAGISSTTVLTLGVWYHVCCTRNINGGAGNCIIYINGVSDATTGTNAVAINTSTAALTFGTDAVNAGRQGNILVQNAMIHNRDLKQHEIMQLYTNTYSMFIK